VGHKSIKAVESQAVPRRILLAEDDGAMRAMLCAALRKEGYVITECPDGVQLLLHLTPLLNATGSVAFDLVISDIRMPGLTGTEVLEGVAGCKSRPPVILITAFGNREAHEEARRCGVAAMLDKPFEIEGLLAEVSKVLGTS
jgi:DNA-binding response OmpR family regulator